MKLTLKIARKRAALPMVHLARRVGCDRSTLYRIENGGSVPHADLAAKLAQVFGEPLRYGSIGGTYRRRRAA